jgi:hypothetical protein
VLCLFSQFHIASIALNQSLVREFRNYSQNDSLADLIDEVSRE